MKYSRHVICTIWTASLMMYRASAIPLIGGPSGPPIRTFGPQLAVLGDSWGSGVAYSPSGAYDGNKDYCLRWQGAYGAQLEHDNWATINNGKSMQFVACSGSRLIDIARRLSGHVPQMDKLKGGLDAIIMTVGGNNAGFFNVVNNCIYHWPPSANYGAAYPDPSGECAKAIATAKDYITRTDNLGLMFDLRATYYDMLQHNVMRDNPNLKVYHTGYARFFNLDGNNQPDSDWCDATQASFTVPTATKSPLTKQLRTAINELATDANRAILATVADNSLKQRIRFVDIDPAFAGHRFCEVGSNLKDQYYSSNIWIWNLVAPGFGASNQTAGPIPDDLVNSPDFDFNVPPVDESVFDTPPPQIASSGNSIAWGWSLRPFHPKAPAYAAIKDVIVAKLKSDKIPGA